MPRVKLSEKIQKDLIALAEQRSGLSVENLAKQCSAHPRTFRDWRRARYFLPLRSFEFLAKLGRLPLEKLSFIILPDYWSAKKAAAKGGRMRTRFHGPPGTFEGRRKGGHVSQVNRARHPELYSHCNLRRTIHVPRESEELAEFLGIILGDGGIQSYQVTVTRNRINDAQYSSYVSKLAERLFSMRAVIQHYSSPRSRNAVGVVWSSVALVEFLLRKGLQKGNKVVHQVDVPLWIKRNTRFSLSCMRGLIDTDGGVFSHRHTSGGYQSYD